MADLLQSELRSLLATQKYRLATALNNFYNADSKNPAAGDAAAIEIAQAIRVLVHGEEALLKQLMPDFGNRLIAFDPKLLKQLPDIELTPSNFAQTRGIPFVPSWQKSPQAQVTATTATVKKVQTLVKFEGQFMQWVCSKRDNEGTRKFYATCYTRLCEFMGKVPLDQIDEPMVEEFKLHVLKKHSRTTCNRYLATLRKALRYASMRLRKFDRVPIVELFEAERGREYVFLDDDYQHWLEVVPEPLRSASILARESGICRGELLALRKDAVDLKDVEDRKGFWGMIHVVRGLKRKARHRDLRITRAMAIVLRTQMALSKCEYVFSSLKDRTQPLTGNTLGNQHKHVMRTAEFHTDAGLHSLRHTFLTEAGRVTKNVRALQRIAGHSQISTTMRYIHPEQDDVDQITAEVQRDRQRRAAESATKFSQTQPEAQTVPAVFPTVQ